MTDKNSIGVCQWCGAEYDKRNIVDGKLSGYKSKYCCKDCRMQAKKEKERERRKRLSEKEHKNTQPKPNRNAYKRWQIRPGPASWANCLGCPFSGWRCRSQDYPRCRHEAEYKRDCAKIYDMLGEGMWIK